MMKNSARIIGTGMTKLGRLHKTPFHLMEEALTTALDNAQISKHELDGIIALQSLSHPHFMEAHFFATGIGLLPRQDILLRTIDTGGSSPVTALLEAKRMIKHERRNAVAVVAADAVLSMDNNTFLERADASCQKVIRNDDDCDNADLLASPVIPNGYDRYAQWIMQEYGVTREQLAMCAVLMSKQASNHPFSYQSEKTNSVLTLDDVLESRPICKVTNLLECARRADGGASFIVASQKFMRSKEISNLNSNLKWKPNVNVIIRSGSEAAGRLYPPKMNEIDKSIFTCEFASGMAFEEAQLECKDIDWFGLYDCFPVTLIRAIESVGLADTGQGGKYIEDIYTKYTQNGKLDVNEFPINTHGGLLGFGAPWEVPAIYNIIEAVAQLSGQAGKRQVENCNKALVYGNGGIFSHSSVAILSKPVEFRKR